MLWSRRKPSPTPHGASSTALRLRCGRKLAPPSFPPKASPMTSLFMQLDRQLQTAIDTTGPSLGSNGPSWPIPASPMPRKMLPIASLSLNAFTSKRTLARLGAEFAAGDAEIEEACTRIEALRRLTGGKDLLPVIITAAALCLNPPPPPPEIIAGVLHRGSKMVLGGGSKSFKTWLLLDLAYRAAHGVPWFGFDTASGPTLYLNFELPGFAIESRLRELAAAIDLPIPEILHLWNLRGYAADATPFFRQFVPKPARSIPNSLSWTPSTKSSAPAMKTPPVTWPT